MWPFNGRTMNRRDRGYEDGYAAGYTAGERNGAANGAATMLAAIEAAADAYATDDRRAPRCEVVKDIMTGLKVVAGGKRNKRR